MGDARTHIDGEPLRTVTVSAPVLDLVREPGADRTPEMQLLHGERFRVHGHREGWLHGAAMNPVESGRTDYVGWVRDEGVAEGESSPTHHVTALRAPVFSEPDLKSVIRGLLPLGARVHAAGEGVGNGGSYRRVESGYVSDKHLAEVGNTAVDDFVDTAESFQGLPYIWGGNGPDGMDCSGLVRLALHSVGVACPRDADQQEAELGQQAEVDTELMTLRRGDLVFWPGHVGVMQTSGRLLHANAHHMRVATEPLREAVARIGAIRTLKRIPQLFPMA